MAEERFSKRQSIEFGWGTVQIVEEGMGPVEAMEKSGKITDGAKWDLFVFAILLGLINLAGLLCLYIGLLVTIPVSMVAMAHVYKTLRWRYETEQLPPAIPPAAQDLEWTL